MLGVGQQPGAHGDREHLELRVSTELARDIRNVIAHCVHAESEPLGDLRVRQSLSEQLKHGGSGDYSWSLGSRRATQARETTGDHSSSVPVVLPPPVNDAGTPSGKSYPSNSSSIDGDILIV